MWQLPNARYNTAEAPGHKEATHQTMSSATRIERATCEQTTAGTTSTIKAAYDHKSAEKHVPEGECNAHASLLCSENPYAVKLGREKNSGHLMYTTSNTGRKLGSNLYSQNFSRAINSQPIDLCQDRPEPQMPTAASLHQLLLIWESGRFAEITFSIFTQGLTKLG